jgi:SHS2 domain-containing protein
MIPFEILDHPADIGFRAFGRTLPELFENAALAMLSIRAEVEDVEPRQESPISATGADFESRLVKLHSEVLYLVGGGRISIHPNRVDTVSET